MSWVKKAAGAVKSATTAAANAVSGVVNTVTQAVAGAIESGAKAAEDAYKATAKVVTDVAASAAEAAAGLPWVGPAVSGAIKAVGTAAAAAIEWVGSAVSAAFTFAATVVKGAGAIVSGTLAGLITMAGGILTLDFGLVEEGALRIVSGVAGAVIMVAGKGIETAQQLSGRQDAPRRLSEAETELLTRVFRGSLTLEHIRVVADDAGPVFGINRREFVLGNTMYLKGSTDEAVFVHEAIHVWQYQRLGANYAADAIYAQWFIDDPYNWRKEVYERGKTDWSQFNFEAQGRFFQNLYTLGELVSPRATSSGNGFFFDADPTRNTFGRLRGVDPDGNDDTFILTALANRAVARVRDTSWLLPDLSLAPSPTPTPA
jgi:hypothetical protein